VRPGWLAGAVALALYLVVRRRAHGRATLVLGALAAAGAFLIGVGAVELPNVEHMIEDAGKALGKWTYLAVGVLAFLETGAFIGLVAPGETTVIVGGLVAGQGQISLMVLIGIVWVCAVLGDITSYTLGRRLGRGFLVRHGERVKITEARLEQVEAFFERRGGMTILIGRFIGLVRAIAPFIAGASHMPLRKFLPYDVLGAGLWATAFCLLGYVFWRSFDQLTAWVSRGLFAFGLLVALVVAIVFLVRLERDAELRARTNAWIAEQLDKPLLRPVAPHLRAGWHRVLRPLGRLSQPPARFVWNRLTPGDLGLEVTTLFALAAVGAFTFALPGSELDDRSLLFGDQAASDIADSLHS
jgi:membrane protein DedA with SNARE-associated domain